MTELNITLHGQEPRIMLEARKYVHQYSNFKCGLFEPFNEFVVIWEDLDKAYEALIPIKSEIISEDIRRI